MGYFGYYLAWVALSYLIRQPALLVGLLVLWLLRSWVPTPGALFGGLARAGRLREQVRVNRANITARRDLATIYLDMLRPRKALPLLEEGLALSPADPELLFLYGEALHRAGRHEAALPQLLLAIEKDARLRHGMPYFVAGKTLLALERWDDAIDAFERYVDFNSSDVAAYTQLARAHVKQGSAGTARASLLEGLKTWHGLPGAMKRRQFGAYLKAQWARAAVLKQPLAIVGVVVLAWGGVLGAWALYFIIKVLAVGSDPYPEDPRARQAVARCGSQTTGDFEGRYTQVQDPPSEAYAVFRIEKDRVVSGNGGEFEAELCLTKVVERTPTQLRAQAVLRHRRHGAYDVPIAGYVMPPRLVDIRFQREGEVLLFGYLVTSSPPPHYSRLEFRRQTD